MKEQDKLVKSNRQEKTLALNGVTINVLLCIRNTLDLLTSLEIRLIICPRVVCPRPLLESLSTWNFIFF